MAKRCQVCDGPVVNGRCKLCGMPYRKDELTYHLNEDRSEHYKHASERVRREMRLEEIPLPDRKTAAGKPSYGKKVSQGTAPAKRTASYTGSSARKQEKRAKRGSGKKWTGLLTAVVIFVISLLPDMIEQIDKLKMKYETGFAGSHAETVDTLGMTPAVELEWTNRPVVYVGTEEEDYYLEPGLYLLENYEGNAVVKLSRADDGESEEYEFHGDGSQELLELERGDTLSLMSLDNKYNFLLLYPIEQYDE